MANGEVNDEQLRLFFDRLDRLEEEKKGISDDITDVYSEAKSQGYDTKIMREVRRLAKMNGRPPEATFAFDPETLDQIDGDRWFEFEDGQS
ncbi:MAG: DUF2312 domain-containing protein [Sphingomonadales bacterium]|nr:DUF2312 domain-containing protein [Sphingomonadales bacterium]